MKKIIKAFLRKTRSKFSRSVESDMYVLSYPKSGRTWLRALIGKYLSLKHNIPENLILSTEIMTSKSNLPRVSFTHNGSARIDKTEYKKLSRDKQKYTIAHST